MTQSKYNVFFEDNGKKFVFNTHSLSILELDSSKYLPEYEPGSGQEKMLLENGFIVPDKDDEELMLKNEYWETVCDNQVLYLSIMPTLNCNLRCPYCFEHHSECSMTLKMADAILVFIRQKIENENLEILKIDWYGGEPTLRMDIISYISGKVINLCAENNVTYISSITTNATLIDDSKVELLKKAGVTNMQITIDGPQYIHDKRRVGIDNQPTFDRIINFIECNKNSFNIVIRINIDKTNEKEVEELLKFLAEKNFYDIPITIKGVVSSEERDVSDTELIGKELSDLIYEKNLFAATLGLKLAMFQSFEIAPNRFCVVDCANQYIVSPDGRLFKCGESYLNNDPGYIGNIDESNAEMIVCESKLNKWIKDPFVDEACKNCSVLPMCFGGCQMKKNVKKASPCNMDLKYHLTDYLKLYLRTLQ